jgi:rSAM/selenodomain-associated transferase 1
MLKYSISQHADSDTYDVLIYCSPDISHPYLQSIKQEYSILLKAQQGHDLGERMYQALEAELQHYKKVALIGSDAPVIDQQYILKAFQLLNTSSVVFGPAEDGGYVMVACTEVKRDWFQGVNWGASEVLSQTLSKVPSEQVKLAQTLWDVDVPEDLNRLRASGLNLF